MGNQNREVVEVCPHCDREVVMQWNVEKDGFKAFCPYCGNKLMLCDECMHRTGEFCNDCDFSWDDDSHTTGHCRFAPEAQNEEALSNTFLVCNSCGYKQYNEETINTFKRDYPHICEYDIPYLCGACQDKLNDKAYYAFLKEAKRIRAQSLLTARKEGSYNPSDVYNLLSEMNEDWDKLFPAPKTENIVELATFPDDDKNYCKHFTVPVNWLEKTLAKMSNGEYVSVSDFLDGYIWDHTFAVYQDAKADGVIISEEEGTDERVCSSET